MNIYLDAETARKRMAYAWTVVGDTLRSSERVKVTITPYKPTRTLEQNALMWAMLGDISAQVQWPVDGKMSYMPSEDWKDVMSAGLRKEQRIAQGMDGGFVILGMRTSKMKVKEVIDLIDLLTAFGTEHNVIWSDP